MSHQEQRSLRSFPRRLARLVRNIAGITSANSWLVYLSILKYVRMAYPYLWSPEVVLSETLNGVLDIYHVDLMLFHWLSYDIGPLISLATKRRIPYAVIHHFDNSRLGTGASSLWVRNAAAVGGVSSRNVPPDIRGKYVNVSDAIDGEFFSPHRARPVARPGGFVVLLPSRIVEGKGHVDLLLAARALVRDGVKLTVVFAGAVVSGALQAQLQRRVADWGLADRVSFLGRLTAQDLRDWYSASDVVVLPSSSEGLGRVLLEAQAMGKPVIAYDCGGMPDALVPDTTGFLVTAGDISALAARIGFLHENPDARCLMGSRGRQFVLEHFTIRSLIERHEQMYRRLLSGRLSRETLDV